MLIVFYQWLILLSNMINKDIIVFLLYDIIVIGEWSMLVYEGIKSEFINDVNLNMIVTKIYERYKKFFGRTTES